MYTRHTNRLRMPFASTAPVGYVIQILPIIMKTPHKYTIKGLTQRA